MSEILRFVMDNAEEILQSLESFSKLKPKEIPKELDDYLGYVAKTGDPVYQWQYVRCLFHEKLAKVITEFYETSPTVDLPPCPNVDPFNYERMKTSLLERLDNFHNAPFTVQRICELLTSPRKQYNRVDKFMRAVEKNILVVSTREPGFAKRSEDDTVLSVNGVPENKEHDSEGESVNIPHDGMELNNATCSPSVTVENAVNLCVIQEEIEINSASSTTAAEDKGWLETNEGKMAIDPANPTTEIDKSDVSTSNFISKTDVVSTSSDLDRASSSMFLETSEKLQPEESSTADENKLIIPAAADSPDSPEPNPEEVLCDASSDEDSCSPQKNYSEEQPDFQLREEDSQTSEVEVSVKTDEPTEELAQLDSTPDSEAVSVVVKSCESLQQIDSTEELHPSSLDMAPDSSNECSTNDESENPINEGTVTQEEEEGAQPDTVTTITSSQVHIQDETVESVAVVSEGLSDTEKTEELVQVELPESDEVTEGTAISDNVASENECSVAIEEVTDSKEAEVLTVNKESEIVEEAPIEREVIVEEEDEEVVDKNVITELQDSSVVVEVCGSSSFEVTAESGSAGGEEEEQRESGSVIHTTQSVCEAEQEELEVEAESLQQESTEDKPAVVESQVEAICIDQSSCEATSEAEAMEVDDNTSNQMTIGELEMNEEEPMDQSDQMQA